MTSLLIPGQSCLQYTGRSDSTYGSNVCSNDMYFTGIQSILAAEKATLIPPLVNNSGGGQLLDEWVATVTGNSINIGEPAAAWSAVSGGQGQQFQGGWIYWSQGTGTHEVQGAINSDYQSLGATGSALGFPASDEQDAPGGGRENLFSGTPCAAGSLVGHGSVILWQSATGANEMQGCIYQAYLQNYGGPGGVLGYPTTDETSMAGGRYNHLAGTTCGSASGSGIYWSGAAHEVYGCIFQKYLSLGEATSGLGFPVSDEYAYNGGRRQDFQGGNIIYTSSAGAVVSFNGTLCTDYGGTTMTGPNACLGFRTAPPAGKPASGNIWFSGGGAGLRGQEIYTYGNGTTASSTAIYSLTGLDTAHVMQLQAYIPSTHAYATHAHYRYCSSGGGCADGYIDQSKYNNVWVAFGSVCTSDGTATIVLADDGGDVYPAEIGADAIRAVRTTLVC